MKQKSSFYVILIIVFLNLNSCSKQDVQILPSETQTGAGTFACIYNGKTLIFQKGDSWASLIIDTARSYQTLEIRGYNSTTSDPEIIILSIKDLFAKKNDYYSFQLNNQYYQGIVQPTASGFYYTTESQHQGIVEITNFDTINGIVSGRFSFTGVKYSTSSGFGANTFMPYNNDIVKIGSGRFDLKIY